MAFLPNDVLQGDVLQGDVLQGGVLQVAKRLAQGSSAATIMARRHDAPLSRIVAGAVAFSPGRAPPPEHASDDDPVVMIPL
jgi:hypothetical protein